MATLADDAPVYRRDSAMSDLNSTYEAVVVGAGPAGIVSVGNLLEKQVGKILWVDETFQGGRINQYYREVPSNTKTKLFLEFAESVAPFRNIVSAGSSKDLLQDIRKLDQEKGCQLSHAADICLMLTSGLKNTPGVTAQPGRVTSATLDERSQTWNVNLTTPTQSSSSSSTPLEPIRTKRLILCTGSTPLDPPLPYEPPGLKHINLDDALSPTTLRTLLTPLSSSRTPTTIAVIGASHSAILVLMNLSRIISSSPHLNLNVKWFTRHPLRYAEYDSSGHVSARDNTGLKGQAAVWAKENLEPLFSSSSSSSSPSTTTTVTSVANGTIQMIRYQKGEEESVYRKYLLEKEQEEKIPSPKFLIQAIGYMKNPIPTLSIIIPKGHTNANAKNEELIMNPIFDHDKGIFLHTPTNNNTPSPQNENEMSKKKQIPGLYGAGIAFPQKILDKKYLHEEMNVGFMKFMKAVKGWVGGWKGVGGE